MTAMPKDPSQDAVRDLGSFRTMADVAHEYKAPGAERTKHTIYTSFQPNFMYFLPVTLYAEVIF